MELCNGLQTQLQRTPTQRTGPGTGHGLTKLTRSAHLALDLLPGPVRCVVVRWSWVLCPLQNFKSAWFGPRCLNRCPHAYLWIFVSSPIQIRSLTNSDRDPPTHKIRRTSRCTCTNYLICTKNGHSSSAPPTKSFPKKAAQLGNPGRFAASSVGVELR